MSGAKKQPKKKSGANRKRKVISPLCNTDDTGSTQVSEDTSTTGLAYTANVNKPKVNAQTSIQQPIDNTPSKRFHPGSPQFFTFQAADMNYSQQNFNGQMYPQGQGQFSPQYVPGTPYVQTPLPSSPPQWATDLIADVKSMKPSVAKIDGIEKSVNIICQKLSDLESKVGSIDKRVADVENNCSFMSAKFDEGSKELKSAKAQVETLNKACDGLKQSMKRLENDRDKLKDKMLDQEYRSMRDNLIFYGIPESRGEGAQGEDCDCLVKDFIKTQLKVDADAMMLDRAHRLGDSRRTSTTRPIVVKFHYHQEREKVRGAAVSEREELRRAKVGVGVQLPREWRDARKSLYPVLQAEKAKGNNVRFVGEKLLINGRPYEASPQ